MDTLVQEAITIPLPQHDDIDIDSIIIGDRYRKDVGDVYSLADSIKKQGLLQPIGITSNNELVFGERRIRAFQSLGWTRIPIRRVNVTSIVEGEHDENEMRKDFTPSERVAIAEAVAKGLGNRQGQRTDLEHAENIPEVGETRDIAAKKAGFGNGKTYEQAKSVIEKGAPELVAQMDSGKVSISAAALVATKEDIDTQRRIVADDSVKKRASELRKAEAELAKVKSIPKQKPTTPEEKDRQKEVFGTKEDRNVWSSINDVVRVLSEQPMAEDAATRIPPSLHHAIDTKEIRMAAMWLADFANAWERNHVA